MVEVHLETLRIRFSIEYRPIERCDDVIRRKGVQRGRLVHGVRLSLRNCHLFLNIVLRPP